MVFPVLYFALQFYIIFIFIFYHFLPFSFHFPPYSPSLFQFFTSLNNVYSFCLYLYLPAYLTHSRSLTFFCILHTVYIHFPHSLLNFFFYTDPIFPHKKSMQTSAYLYLKELRALAFDVSPLNVTFVLSSSQATSYTHK